MGDRTAAQVLSEWQTLPSGAGVFLLSITDGEIEAVSRLACQDGHPLQSQALALLRALYATD